MTKEHTEEEIGLPNSDMLNKTAQEKADAVSAFINTARLTGRATFMAGFSYYSVGMEYLGERVPSCCVLM